VREAIGVEDGWIGLVMMVVIDQLLGIRQLDRSKIALATSPSSRHSDEAELLLLTTVGQLVKYSYPQAERTETSSRVWMLETAVVCMSIISCNDLTL
jgi:hypothetical protein